MESKVLKVFICIRLRPKSKDPIKATAEFEENLRRARVVARYAVLNGYDPEATTIYFTQFLNDSRTNERELGMKIGQERLLRCSELWCVLDDYESPSSGMESDMEIAGLNNIPIMPKKFDEITEWIKNYNRTSR